jgi:D-alanyl-D-alanine carboxypeptidase
MITLFCVFNLTKRFNIDQKKTLVTISKEASRVTGCSAYLKAGDKLTVWDLCHGMMLPSGNDSSY